MAKRFDLLIRGGTLVDDVAERPGEVAIREGRIAAIGEPGTFDATEAERTLDADGRHVIPGGVDAHVHFNFGLPPILSQPYEQGSRAALYGGTTTVLDFAFRAPGAGSLLNAVNEKRNEADGAMACDYGLHLIVAGEVDAANLDEVAQVVAAGVPSLKVFMNFPALYPGDGGTAALFAAVAHASGMGVVHAENGDVIEQRASRLIAEGNADYRYADDSRPAWVEAEAVERAVTLATAAGVPLFVLHVTSRDAVDVVAAARASGKRVFAETCHNYLVYSKADVVGRADGANWGNFPPLRPEDHRDALWEALASGVIDHVSTDDYTNDLENRNSVGLDLPTPPAGHNGVETRLAVLYTEAVVKRGLAMTEFVALASSRIARILGLWPRKGSLEVGADADIVLFDSGHRGVFRLADLHTADYSIWDGYQYAGRPTTTILRGEVVVAEGAFVGTPNGGQFVPRTHEPTRPRRSMATAHG
jgi:dihydropyrimidinase